MPKARPQPPRNKLKFISQTDIRRSEMDLSQYQSASLRSKLPKGIYWMQPTGRSILWNWVLLQDYLVNGDRPEHQALVEEYLSTLPQSA